MNYLLPVIAFLFFTGACYDAPQFESADESGILSKASTGPEGSNSGNAIIKESTTITSEEFVLSVAPFKESSITFDHFNGYIELDFEMVREKTIQNVSISTTQSKLRDVSEVFTQGIKGTFTEQEESQNNLGMMDILVVVDNSGSMGDEHNKIKTKLPELVNKISGFDWQVRVVSTSLKKPKKDLFEIFPADDTCNRFPVISSLNPTAASVFKKQIEELGTQGDSEERGIRKAIDGITCKADPWLRSGADLAVLFVTDEDSYRSFLGLGQDDAKPSELKALLNSRLAKGLTDTAKLYGIFDLPNVACEDATNANIYYNDLILDPLYGGYAGSICDPDYTATFDRISMDLRNQLVSTFTLQYPPTEQTISVEVDGNKLQADDFVVAGNEISLLVAPDPGSDIIISYYYGGTERRTDFNLINNPASVKAVSINGDLLTEGSYEVITEDGISRLSFAEYPEDEAQIIISYNYEDEELTASFEVDKNLVEGTLKVKVDDVDAPYTLVDGIVQLSPIPPEGSRIVISFDIEITGEIDHVIKLDYSSNSVSELSVFDKDSGAEIPHTLEDRSITLAVDQITEGQFVVVRYYYDQSEYDLSQLEGDYEILNVTLADTEGQTEECHPEEYEVINSYLNLQCGQENLATVTVNIVSTFESTQTFEVPVSDYESCNWSVWINEQEASNYWQEKNMFTLENLEPEASITIVCDRS